jgi:PQQ-dependent catabolism-associated beta-propeller protein
MKAKLDLRPSDTHRHGRACPGHPRVAIICKFDADVRPVVRDDLSGLQQFGVDARDKRGHDALGAMMTQRHQGKGLIRLTLAILAALFSFASATPADAYLVYVSNEKGNSITIIDTDKLEAIKTVKVGRRPRGIELTNDGSELFICAGDDDTIQVLDTKTLQITGSLPSGPDPELMTLSPDGKTVYVSNENDNLVTMIDAKRKERIGDVPVGVEPEGMALSPDGKILVNTSETTNMAHLIDTQTKKIVANILVDARPRFAEFKKDGSELWVSAEVGGTISVIDPVQHVVTQKINFDIPGLTKEAIQPIGISITRDGKRAFVALGPANRVAVIDAQSKKVEKYLLVGQRVWHLAFTPDEKYLLTANGVSNDVSVIDVASLKVVKSIPVGSFPWGVAVAPQ